MVRRSDGWVVDEKQIHGCLKDELEGTAGRIDG